MSENHFGHSRAPKRHIYHQRHTIAQTSPTEVKIPTIAIEHLTLTERGNTKAFATVRIGKGGSSFVTRGWRVVQEPGQKAWVGVPSQERQRIDAGTGEQTTRYYPTVELPEPWQRAIEATVLAAWHAYQLDGILPGVAA